MRFILIALLILLAGCKSDGKKPDPEPPVERPNAIVLDWKNADWDRYLVAQIGERFDSFDVASDVDRFCPNYRRLPRADRINVWAHILVALAKFESRYNPKSKMEECSKKPGKYKHERYVSGHGYCMVGGHAKDGGIVISRGLFQMSLSSAQSYKCALSEPSDLHDPFKNIACAVRIFSGWVSKDKVVQGLKIIDGKKVHLGGGRYWSPFRPGHHTEEIIAKVSALKMCSS